MSTELKALNQIVTESTNLLRQTELQLQQLARLAFTKHRQFEINEINDRQQVDHQAVARLRQISEQLAKLSQRMGFRVAPGLAERVVFRSLFLKGLTVADLPSLDEDWQDTPSHRAARQELEDYVGGRLSELFLGFVIIWR